MAIENIQFFNKVSIWAMLTGLLKRDVIFVVNDGAPTSGAAGTAFGKAGPGSLVFDYTNGQVYINTNTKASPTWTKVADSVGDLALARGFVLRGSSTGLAEAYDANNSGQILVGDGTDIASVAVSGDVTLASNGAVTIGNAKVLAAMIAAGAVTPVKQGLAVRNESGSTIAVDKLVAISGFDVATGLPKIVLADADVAGHDNVYVTTAAILTAASGTVYRAALSVANLDTNAITSAGDPVFLDVTAGAFAVAAPTGSDDTILPVGFVVVKSATVGQIYWNIGEVRKIATNNYQALSIDAAALAAGAVTLAKINPNTIDGTIAANVANVNVIGGIPVIHRVTATALTGDVDVVLTHKTRIINVYCIATGGAGGAGDTITVKNGASAITNAIDMNVADATVVRVGTVDDANWDIAAAGTLRISGASAVNCEVIVEGIRVA